MVSIIYKMKSQLFSMIYKVFSKWTQASLTYNLISSFLQVAKLPIASQR